MTQSLVYRFALSLAATSAVTVLAYGPSAPADPAPAPKRWSIERIRARAVEASAGTRALAADVTRDRALARQAGRWENPTLSFSYGPMTQADVRGRSVDVAVKQKVPLFGESRLAERIGDGLARASELERNQADVDVRTAVTTLAYRLAAVMGEQQHVTHRRDAVRAVARFLNTRPHASPMQVLEKVLLENRLRDIEDEFIELTAGRDRLWQDLNLYLDLAEPIEPDVDWTTLPPIPDRAAARARLDRDNPRLRPKLQAVAVARLREDQARLRQYPEVRLGAGHGEQTADLPQRIVNGSVELTLPILDRGGHAVEAAAAARLGETHRLDLARREVNSRFERAWSDLEQSRKRMDLNPGDALAVGERQMRDGEVGWRRGQIPTADFLELEHQTHARTGRYYAARIEYLAAIGELRALGAADAPEGTPRAE